MAVQIGCVDMNDLLGGQVADDNRRARFRVCAAEQDDVARSRRVHFSQFLHRREQRPACDAFVTDEVDVEGAVCADRNIDGRGLVSDEAG